MAAVSEDLRDRLRSALGEGPPLRLASLFGSAARGRMHASSDVDVGIVPVEGSPVERKRFVAEAAIEHAELAPAFERALDLQDAIALSLLVAIQEAVDIAFHVAVDEG